MQPKESKRLLTVTQTNLIEVNPVPTADCVYGITAMAINTLSTLAVPLTGNDIERVSAEAGLEKGDFNELFLELNKRVPEINLEMVWQEETLTKAKLFDFYRLLINHAHLIFVDIDNPNKWYEEIKYQRRSGQPIPDVPHALLVNGYRSTHPRYFRGPQTRELYVRDPNISKQLLVPVSMIYEMLGNVSKSTVIAFRNKQEEIPT